MAQPASVATSPPNQAAAQTLIAVAHQAYTLYPKNCSGSVHYIITQLVDPNAPYLLANQLMQWLASPANGWRQVTLKEASDLANQGKVVVGGLAQTGGHGHVVIVLLGQWKMSGGYLARGQVMPSSGMYPLAMSTSLGPWPGAVSDGTKTVFDPWGDRRTFQKVSFWTKSP